MEDVKRVELLARRRKQYRSAGDSANRKRSASARVAIELGENDARYLQPLVKSLRDVGGFLARHSIGDEHDMMRPDGSLEPFQLLHQVFVDLQASRGIDQDRVVAADFCA